MGPPRRHRYSDGDDRQDGGRSRSAAAFQRNLDRFWAPLLYALRLLAGIGGFQLPGLLSPAALLFVVLSVVAAFFTRDRRGLPALLSATTLKDDAAQGSSEHAVP